MIYFKSSAVLTWLFDEPKIGKMTDVVDNADRIATSVLTLVESRRALVQLTARGQLKENQRERALGYLERSSEEWELIQLSDEILHRAGELFPVEPVRALDALHLATAISLGEANPGLSVLSLDKRILANLEPLGLVRAL